MNNQGQIELIVTVVVSILVALYRVVQKRSTPTVKDRVDKYESNVEVTNEGLVLSTDTQAALTNTIGYLVDHSKMVDKKILTLEKEKTDLLIQIQFLQEKIQMLEKSSEEKDGKILKLEESSLEKQEEIKQLKRQRLKLLIRVKELEDKLRKAKLIGTDELTITEAHEDFFDLGDD